MKLRIGLTALAAGDVGTGLLPRGRSTSFNWSDYIAEDTIEKFQEETGIQVVYDVYDSNDVLEARLLAGSSG